MESFALSCIGEYFNKNIITLLAVSDNLITGESIPPEDRERKVNNLFECTREIAYTFS